MGERGRGKNGVLVYRRRLFQDPLLTVYVFNGEPVYAESFLVKEKWWEGLLSDDEVETYVFDNLYRYAFQKNGDRYLQRLKEYTQRVIENAIKTAMDNGWELEKEFMDIPPEKIASMFSILPDKDTRTYDPLNMGFVNTYVEGSEDLNDFLRMFGPIRENVLKLMRAFGDFEGSIGFVLPVYNLVRIDLGHERVWAIADDPETFVRSLLHFKKPFDVSVPDITEKVKESRVMWAMWGYGKDRIILCDSEDVRMLRRDEGVGIVRSYHERLRRILNAIPLDQVQVPKKMVEIMIRNAMARNPDPNALVKEVESRLKVSVETEEENGN